MAAIKQHEPDMPIVRACRALDVPRASSYRALAREAAPAPRHPVRRRQGP